MLHSGVELKGRKTIGGDAGNWTRVLRAEVSVHTVMNFSFSQSRGKEQRRIESGDARLRRNDHIKSYSVSLMTLYPNSENQWESAFRWAELGEGIRRRKRSYEHLRNFCSFCNYSCNKWVTATVAKLNRNIELRKSRSRYQFIPEDLNEQNELIYYN